MKQSKLRKRLKKHYGILWDGLTALQKKIWLDMGAYMAWKNGIKPPKKQGVKK